MWREKEPYSLEVCRQGIGQHVIGSTALVVDQGLGAHGLIEITRVEHKITADPRDALTLNCLEHAAKMFLHEKGIATTLDQQVARQRALINLAQRINRSRPGIGRAQLLQRGESGQGFHR